VDVMILTLLDRRHLYKVIPSMRHLYGREHELALSPSPAIQLSV